MIWDGLRGFTKYDVKLDGGLGGALFCAREIYP